MTRNLALIFACASVIACGAPSAPPTEGSASLSSNSVPRFFPNYVKPCPAAQLLPVMRNYLNPALTAILNPLFHSDAPDEARLNMVADAAAVILGCTEKVHEYRPTLDDNDALTYEHFLNQLVMNAHALQTAALEDDLEEVTHWYHHVKQSCAACHSRFKR